MFNPKWIFDFKISFDNHVVLLAPGKQISVRVKVDKIRGGRQPVMLNVSTNWESMGLVAWINPPALVPDPQWTATMMIRASATTPPNSYLFTVRGSAEGTFNTSEDAITVIVDPEAEQKEDEKDYSQSVQVEKTGSPSFSLDNLFAPPFLNSDAKKAAVGKGKMSRAWARLTPKEIEKIDKQTKVGSVIGVIVGIIILGIVFAKSGIFQDLFKGGGSGIGCPPLSGCGTIAPQCECPSNCPKYFIITNPPSMKGYKQCHN